MSLWLVIFSRLDWIHFCLFIIVLSRSVACRNLCCSWHLLPYLMLVIVFSLSLHCVLFSTINRASCYLLQGWMGPNYSISTACATSNFCILSAANHIIRGEAVSFWLIKSLMSCAFNLLSKAVDIPGGTVITHVSTRPLGSSIWVQYVSSHVQDIMLSGGSDAAVIPIGKKEFWYCLVWDFVSSGELIAIMPSVYVLIVIAYQMLL